MTGYRLGLIAADKVEAVVYVVCLINDTKLLINCFVRSPNLDVDYLHGLLLGIRDGLNNTSIGITKVLILDDFNSSIFF